MCHKATTVMCVHRAELGVSGSPSSKATIRCCHVGEGRALVHEGDLLLSNVGRGREQAFGVLDIPESPKSSALLTISMTAACRDGLTRTPPRR